jgi:hypothetical protein
MGRIAVPFHDLSLTIMQLGTHNLLFITLDTLRYDVAQAAWRAGQTPALAAHLPPAGWEARHTPGSFTYAAHHAFFAGFLPTPIGPGPHPRRFAARFPGSESTGEETLVLDAPDIARGLAAAGYHTLCVGGVGFFNLASPLGSVLPGLFAEALWEPCFGVTEPRSTAHQVTAAIRGIERLPRARRLFLFLNISALHQPNYFYLQGATEDSPASQQAALTYVDAQLPPLFEAIRAHGPTFAILCADHGTAYGEEGYTGHRLAHPVVWTVPYAEFYL